MPTTLLKRILFLNQMNKKGLGGKHNVLVHCVNVCAPDSSDVVLFEPFQMRYFLVCTVHIHFKSLKCLLCVSLHCEIPVGLQD